MPPERDHLSRIRAQFDRQASAYEKLAVVSDRKPLAGLVRLSGVTRTERALDVACGPGFLTMEFAAAARRTTGIDATPTFLEHARAEARRRGLSNLDFLRADVGRLPIDDHAFDVASCRAAFHHFPDPGAVLREMIRVVRPAGRLLIADFLGSEDPQMAALHDRIERLCDPTHVSALAESAFARLFAEHGLTVLHAARSRIEYRLDEWLAHGGPSPGTAREIETLLRASIDGDCAGLEVRLHEEGLRFRHLGVAFLLARPA